MRWARVAASREAAGLAACAAGEAIASVFAAVMAIADAAVICFRKDLLELSLHSMADIPLWQRIHPDRRGKYISYEG
jgi:hypothetical protein